MKLNFLLIFWCCSLLLMVGISRGAETGEQDPNRGRHFDQSFKDRYSGQRYNYDGREIVGESTSKFGDRSKHSDNKPKVKEERNSKNFSFNFNILNGIFIFILILAVTYLAYILLRDGNSRLFFRKAHKKLQTSNDITAENLQQTDVKALIDSAEKDKNYRLAIRYYYLLVLKQLALRKYITYKEDKTNADYREAIASHKFSQKFAYTSYIYDYTWYGEFTLDFTQYKVAKDQFVQLLKEVNS